jgi:hypothetical protein
MNNRLLHLLSLSWDSDYLGLRHVLFTRYYTVMDDSVVNQVTSGITVMYSRLGRPSINVINILTQPRTNGILVNYLIYDFTRFLRGLNERGISCLGTNRTQNAARSGQKKPPSTQLERTYTPILQSQSEGVYIYGFFFKHDATSPHPTPSSCACSPDTQYYFP